MPTVLRVAGYRLYFWSREPNEPPHIHVDRDGSTAKIWLQNIALASSVGFPPHEIGAILRLVRTHQSALLEAWYDFFSQH